MEFHLITRPQRTVSLPGALVGPTQVPLAGVDWPREFVLVADMGEQRTAGYAVQPGPVTITGAQAEVVLNVQTPPRGSMVAQVITHPYAVVRIPRAGLPPEAAVVVRDQAGRELARLLARLDQEG